MRLVLAAGQLNFRLALELLLSEQPGVDIVGTASECAGLSALVQTTKPDLILAEWDLPGISLPKIIGEADSLQPPPMIMILINENSSYQTALQAGANAVVLKGISPDVLLAAFNKFRHQYSSNQEINSYE